MEKMIGAFGQEFEIDQDTVIEKIVASKTMLEDYENGYFLPIDIVEEDGVTYFFVFAHRLNYNGICSDCKTMYFDYESFETPCVF